MKKKVRFEYQRQVLWGAEQATLNDAIASMGLVADDSRLGELYRRMYGSSSAANAAAAADAVSAAAYSGQAFIVVESAVRVPKDLVVTLPLSGANKEEIDLSKPLQPIEGKVAVTPEQAAALCNALLLSGQLHPYYVPNGFAKPSTGLFVTDQFMPRSDGAGKTYENTALNDVTIQDLLTKVLGSSPAFLTPADASVLKTAADYARAIGATLAEVSAAKRPAIGDPAKFLLRANWGANDLSAGDVGSQSEEADWLRFHAERPGGRNFSDDIADLLPEGTFSTEGITGDSASSIRRQSVAAAAKSNPALAEALKYDVRRPQADIQKKDTYAVLRIASGFSERLRDIYAKPAPFRTIFQTNRFLLQSSFESRAERSQVVETFGDNFIYLFGERPNVWNYSGVLMDTVGLDWLNEWRAAWKSIMSGTKTAKAKARAFLVYRDVVREGILVASSDSITVNETGFANFSFSMYVIREHFIDGDPKPGQTSPEMKSAPQSGAKASAEENYDFSFLDNTPAPGVGTTERRVGAIEAQLSSGRKSAIESGITKQAFSGGRLVAYAGAVDLPLQTAAAQSAVSAALRLASESQFAPSPDMVAA